MIETIAVPILIKAVEFLFDESKKVLEERRKRRDVEIGKQQTTEISDKEKKTVEAPYDNPGSMTDARTDLLSSKLDLDLLKVHEKDLTHLLELCEIYKSNLYITREKYARFGRDYAPPHLLHELKEYENDFLDTVQKLRKILVKIYGKEIMAPELF